MHERVADLLARRLRFGRRAKGEYPMRPGGELWEGLTPEERNQVARSCPEKHFPKGSTIFAPGDAPDALDVLVSGLVTLSHVSEDGQESILRVFGPGDVFGALFLTVKA